MTNITIHRRCKDIITAGIDAGNKNTKALILKDGEIISRALTPSGFDQEQAAREALLAALTVAGLGETDLDGVLATGAGQAAVSFASGAVTDVSAAARGAIALFPEARTVIDVGAEEGRAVKIDGTGKVIDFVISEKCAAGTGSFVEAMSRALDVTLEEMGSLSLQGEKSVPMNAQCAVFAESEVVSLIHARISKADIAKSIHAAMAGRISAMVRRIGMQREVAMIGGVAHNKGFVKAMENELESKVLVHEEYAEYICALGAALIAAEKAGVS